MRYADAIIGCNNRIMKLEEVRKSHIDTIKKIDREISIEQNIMNEYLRQLDRKNKVNSKRFP